jgi:uncharacterized membrane protein (DUF2068 family)
VLTANRLIVIVVLAVAGFAVWRVALPAEKKASDATGDAAIALLDTRTTARFTVAQANLQAQLQATGSYAGAAMPEGVALIRADSGGYCVQVGPPGAVWHLAGPAGSAVSGGC